jgi:hypothetical protein
VEVQYFPILTVRVGLIPVTQAFRLIKVPFESDEEVDNRTNVFGAAYTSGSVPSGKSILGSVITYFQCKRLLCSDQSAVCLLDKLPTAMAGDLILPTGRINH